MKERDFEQLVLNVMVQTLNATMTKILIHFEYETACMIIDASAETIKRTVKRIQSHGPLKDILGKMKVEIQNVE